MSDWEMERRLSSLEQLVAGKGREIIRELVGPIIAPLVAARFAAIEERLKIMDAHIQAIADKEATLETVVEGVVGSFTELKAKLDAAVAAQDWGAVDALAAPLDRSIAALQALVAPTVEPPPAA